MEFSWKRGAFNGIVRGETTILVKKAGFPELKRRQVLKFAFCMETLGTKGYVVTERGLKDGLLYLRHGLPFVSEKSFEKILKGKKLPIKNRRILLPIDGKKLREMREKKGYSLAALSRQLGIPRITLFRYEAEICHASEENAKKLLEFFGEEILAEVNPKVKGEVKKDSLCREVEEIGGKAGRIDFPVDVIGRLGEKKFAVVYSERKAKRTKVLETYGIKVLVKGRDFKEAQGLIKNLEV